MFTFQIPARNFATLLLDISISYWMWIYVMVSLNIRKFRLENGGPSLIGRNEM